MCCQSSCAAGRRAFAGCGGRLTSATDSADCRPVFGTSCCDVTLSGPTARTTILFSSHREQVAIKDAISYRMLHDNVLLRRNGIPWLTPL